VGSGRANRTSVPKISCILTSYRRTLHGSLNSNSLIRKIQLFRRSIDAATIEEVIARDLQGGYSVRTIGIWDEAQRTCDTHAPDAAQSQWGLALCWPQYPRLSQQTSIIG